MAERRTFATVRQQGAIYWSARRWTKCRRKRDLTLRETLKEGSECSGQSNLRGSLSRESPS